MRHMHFRPLRPGVLRASALMSVLLLLSGCFGDGKQSTIRPATDIGRVIQNVYALVTWIDIGIFLVVAGLLLTAVVRFRARAGQEGEMPKQTHGNAVMEVVWTVVPAVILIFIAVPTWSGIFKQDRPPEQGGMQVEAIGHQWWWEFNYPDQGVVTANELYLPVGATVVVHTFSKDVIHSFWVPRLAGKIDTMPGRTNTLWFTAENEGLYYGQCAEFCGTSHANMRFRVRVVSQDEFDTWLENAQRPPTPQSESAKLGQQLFTQKACISCHTIEGVPIAAGKVGPNLTNLPARSGLAAAILEMNRANLVRWIHDPQGVKPGAKMVLPIPVSEEEAGHLADYLLSPPGSGQGAAAGAGQATATAAAAPASTEASEESAAQIMQKRGCVACHTVPGVPGAVGTLGPNLGGLMSRPTMAGGKLKTSAENIRKWLHDPKAVKPDTIMPTLPLTGAEIDTLVEYLTTLK